MSFIPRVTLPQSCAQSPLRQLARSAAVIVLLAGAQSAIAGSCSVSSSGLAFGSYQPLIFAGKLTSADVLSTATISISCAGISLGGSYTISLGPTSAGGSSSNPRRLSNSNGGDAMQFNVYTDATRQTVWGDGATGAQFAGTIAINLFGTQTFSHTAYGKIPGSQNTLNAGSFSATPTMTLIYNP